MLLADTHRGCIEPFFLYKKLVSKQNIDSLSEQTWDLN